MNNGAREIALFFFMDKKVLPFEEIKKKMAAYCAYQDRSHSEVEQKLREFMLIPEARDEVLLYLMRENYLNEERFARSYIRGKFRMKEWGRTKIRMHLRQKGVPEKLIDQCMDEIDEDEYITILQKNYQKAYENAKGLQDYQRKMKAVRYCLSRGFEYELISEINTK